jgi:hypothetical protein
MLPDGLALLPGRYPDGWKDFILMAVLQAEYVRGGCGSAGI